MKLLAKIMLVLSGFIIIDSILSLFVPAVYRISVLLTDLWYWNRILELALVVFAVSLFFLINDGFRFRNSRTKYGITIAIGAIITLAALPVGALILISTSCCGGPSTGYEFVGPLLGVILLILGITLLVTGIAKLHRTRNI